MNGHMKRLALIVEYEGTNYHGFQYQANAPSIQGQLELSITRLTWESPRVTGAGRTDAGVHAKGQVVAFDTESTLPPETFLRALNYYLPDDIAVKEAYLVDNDFDPRRMARSRRYRYTINCGPTPSPLKRLTSYHLGEALDFGLMQRAAKSFVGRHDFARFAGPLEKPEASTIRQVLEALIARDGDVLDFEVEAQAFLPRQVRRMAGALVQVGRSAITADDLKSMIDLKQENLTAPALPPLGLCLLEVTYARPLPKAVEKDGS